MNRIVVILLHIGYWFMYLLLLLIMFGVFSSELGRNNPDAQLSEIFWNWTRLMCGFALLPGLIGFYVYYTVLFNKFLKKKRLLLLFSGIVITGLIGVGAGFLVLRLLSAAETNTIWADGNVMFSVSLFLFFITTVNGILGLVMNGFVQWYGDIRLKEELHRKNFETELALIKAQLNPHFLFNTINNIDVLIQLDPEKASEYLNKLSDMLRFLLYEGKKDMVLLKRELEYIEKYIELQRIRTNNASFVRFETTGQAGETEVAGMLFIPFIENAFKHAENKKAEEAISIRLDISQARISFECRNAITSGIQSAPESGGLGNQLIRRRLELLYPGKHHLETTNTGKEYFVKLEIAT